MAGRSSVILKITEYFLYWIVSFLETCQCMYLTRLNVYSTCIQLRIIMVLITVNADKNIVFNMFNLVMLQNILMKKRIIILSVDYSLSQNYITFLRRA